MSVEERAKIVSKVLRDWFNETNKLETTPEEIMPYLIDRNIYKDDSRNDALRLRRDLRKLVEKNKLYMLEEAEYVQKKINKQWYFVKR